MRTAEEPMPVWSFFLQTGEKRNFQGEETFQINTKLLHVKLLQLHLTLCDPMDCSPPGSSVHGDFPGKNTRVGCHALLQGIYPTQGLNLGLPHCRWILYCLSHHRSSRILEPIPSPRDLPDPGIKLGFPALQANSLPSEPPGKQSDILTKDSFSHTLDFI